MTVNDAIAAKDWAALGRIAREEFGVCVSISDLRNSCLASIPRGKPSRGKRPGEIESELPWLKNRLAEIGAFEGLGQLRPVKFKTPLHIFFPHLEETEDMLAMLAWDEEQIKEAEARSKVFSTHLVPVPIDRVAQRVSGIQRENT